MIFFLEIDGKLTKCLVHEPYCRFLATLNSLRQVAKSQEVMDALRDAAKSAARDVVESGQYRVAE